MEPNPFTSINVQPGYAKGHLLYWSIDPAFYRPAVYSFSVQASGTVDFSELLFDVSVGNSFFFLDKSNLIQNQQTNLFYRVILIVGAEKFVSATVIPIDINANYTRRQYRIASEVARKEVLRAEKFTGGDYYLLKLRTYGEDATDSSIDPVTGLALTSTSPNFGSAKRGGYYNPIKFYMTLEDGECTRKLNPDGAGILESLQLTMRVPSFPIIDTNDVVVDLTADSRYLVKDRQNTPFPGTSLNVIQTIRLSLIPPTDAIYNIDIKDE